MKSLLTLTIVVFSLIVLSSDSACLVENIKVEYPDMRNISALELAKEMGIGWNLGNSLESINANKGVLSGNETTWGNPIITQQLIDSVKAAGFNAVRIPVSWSHQLENSETHQIKEEWLYRVEEVVNYVLNNNMYAIINLHWDGGWLNQPFYNKQEELNNKVEALWEQIALRFIDYNDYLLFAGTNEVHVTNNWDAPTRENAEVQNSFNQTFVNTVRACGKRNLTRHLLVQGYNTNIEHTANYFVLPNDIIPDRLMVEVHYYDPYDFALNEGKDHKSQWGKPFTEGDVSSWGQEEWVNETFGKMKSKFIDKGIPVVLGEYGAIRRMSLESGYENHVESLHYYLSYVTHVALEYGLVPVYWDNGYTGNNGFGLFDRENGIQIYPGAINAIINSKSE